MKCLLIPSQQLQQQYKKEKKICFFLFIFTRIGACCSTMELQSTICVVSFKITFCTVKSSQEQKEDSDSMQIGCIFATPHCWTVFFFFFCSLNLSINSQHPNSLWNKHSCWNIWLVCLCLFDSVCSVSCCKQSV